jgi:hypothetical protein
MIGTGAKRFAVEGVMLSRTTTEVDLAASGGVGFLILDFSGGAVCPNFF